MRLTLLSYGGGQDSKYELSLLIEDPEFRKEYAPDRVVVVMADTGDEHPETLADLEEVRSMCKKAGILFVHITPDMGYHSPSWPSLMHAQTVNGVNSGHPTMVQLGTKSCTDKLKIVPIYNWLDVYINKEMGYNLPTYANGTTHKRAITKFINEGFKVDVLIGFAFGEESRVASSEQYAKSSKKKWEAVINRRFPLVDLGIDRAKAQQGIKKYGYNCPPPSNCMRCPYMSDQELVWLERHYPDKYREWVAIEADKLARHANEPDRFVEDKKTGIEYLQPFKNHGVFNTKKTIPQRLEEAKLKYGSMTDQELDEYKFNHGCTKNGM